MRLQKVPTAFLDALELKSDGIAPPQFADAVAGVVNLEAFYWAQQLQTLAVDGTVTLNGAELTTIVPQGQYWRVHSISGVVDMPAAAAERMQGGVTWRPAGSSRRQVLAWNMVDATVGQDAGFGVSWSAPFPMIAAPGTVLGFLSGRTYAAARNASLVVAYWPFGGV